MVDLRIVDSITELGPEDHGCIAVSGSHGGMSSARYALAARPLLSVFNDAGVGKDAAGLAALAFLQSFPVTRWAHSGEAQSTLEDGVISHANPLAAAMGVGTGQNCKALVETMRARR